MIVKNSLLGMAIGESFGLPIKNVKRQVLLDSPVTNMNKPSDDIPKGTWSFGTSTALAVIDSIIMCKEISLNDIANNFCSIIKDGNFTALDKMISIDDTNKKALTKYMNNMKLEVSEENEIKELTNTCLPRMIPITLYCFYNKLRDHEIFENVRDVCKITHSSDVCTLGSYIFVKYLLFILNGKDKYASYNMIKLLDYREFFDEDIVEYYNRLLKTDISHIRVDDLKSTDYIVYTLETIIWVILNCSSFAETIVGAANLGGDTDIITLLVGSIAGIIYGQENIPSKWLECLKKINYLEDIATRFEKELER